MAINYPQRYDDDFLNTVKTLIDHVNVHGKTIQDLVAEGQLTPAQYAELLTTINSLVKSGHVDKSDLTPEFKDEIEGFSTQLAQKAQKVELDQGLSQKRDKNVPIHLNDAGSDLLEAIAGGENTSFNILSIPKDGSVDHLKTDFIERGKNILNKNRIVQGYVINVATGNISQSSANSYVEYERVSPSTTYTKNWSAPSQVCFYDEEYNFIGGESTQTFTTPENCYFIQYNITGKTGKDLQLEEGTVSTKHEDYYLRLKEAKYDIDTEDIKPKAVVPNNTDFVRRTKNLFNKEEALIGYVINVATGDLSQSAVNSCSGFVEVEEFEQYAKNFSSPSHVLFYGDKTNDSFISGVAEQFPTIPKGCNYVRFNFPTRLLDVVQFEKGSKSTAFEPYGNEEIDFKYEKGVLAVANDINVNTSKLYRLDGIQSFGELDKLYPFNSLRVCNISKTSWDAPLVTYEGEERFARDGSNGDVFVEIPKVYFKRYHKNNVDYLEISGTAKGGFHLDPAFIENGKELNAIYVGVYDGYIENDKLYSRSGVYSSRYTSLTQLRQYAQNKGSGYGNIDYRTIALLQRLFMVYFADRNSQDVVGGGFTQMHYQSFSTTTARESAMASNDIVINTAGHPNRHFLVGDSVTVSNEFWVFQDRKITNTESAGVNLLRITFDGEPVDIVEGTTRIYHIPQPNGQTDAMTKHSGSANIYGVEGHDAVKLFHIENLWGNIWTLLDGVYLDNLVAYVGENMSDYTSDDSYRQTYKPLAMTFSEQTSNVQDQDTEFDFFIKNLALDPVNPAYQIPRVIGTSGENSHFCDPWYAHNKPSQIPSFGGGWDLWFRAGIFSTRFWYDADQPHNLNTGRLIYKPI